MLLRRRRRASVSEPGCMGMGNESAVLLRGTGHGARGTGHGAREKLRVSGARSRLVWTHQSMRHRKPPVSARNCRQPMNHKLPVGATSRRDRQAADPQRWSRHKGAPTNGRSRRCAHGDDKSIAYDMGSWRGAQRRSNSVLLRMCVRIAPLIKSGVAMTPRGGMGAGAPGRIIEPGLHAETTRAP